MRVIARGPYAHMTDTSSVTSNSDDDSDEWQDTAMPTLEKESTGLDPDEGGNYSAASYVCVCAAAALVLYISLGIRRSST